MIDDDDDDDDVNESRVYWWLQSRPVNKTLNGAERIFISVRFV